MSVTRYLVLYITKVFNYLPQKTNSDSRFVVLLVVWWFYYNYDMTVECKHTTEWESFRKVKPKGVDGVYRRLTGVCGTRELETEMWGI